MRLVGVGVVVGVVLRCAVDAAQGGGTVLCEGRMSIARKGRGKWKWRRRKMGTREGVASKSDGREKERDVDEKKDLIITALIGSGTNIVSESEAGPVRDAGLLATAQKIEHYEIASYGSARDWATILGLVKHAELLQKTLDEEKHADKLLSAISQRTNATAATA